SSITPLAFRRGLHLLDSYPPKLARMRSTLRQKCFRKRLGRDIQENSQSEETSTCTSSLEARHAKRTWCQTKSATHRLPDEARRPPRPLGLAGGRTLPSAEKC